MTLPPEFFSKLPERQRSLLELIARYRLLTLSLLQGFCSDLSRDAARIALNRMHRAKLLARTLLPNGEPCYALGTRAQRALGMHHRPGFPFSTDGIVEHLAQSYFARLAGFHRMLPDEFHARFPGMYRRGLPAQSYCLDLSDNESVCWIVVDHASDAKRFPGKVFRIVSARLPLDGFDELVRNEKFRIVIITATPQKRDRIQRAIDESPPVCVPVSVVVIPPLLGFYLT